MRLPPYQTPENGTTRDQPKTERGRKGDQENIKKKNEAEEGRKGGIRLGQQNTVGSDWDEGLGIREPEMEGGESGGGGGGGELLSRGASLSFLVTERGTGRFEISVYIKRVRKENARHGSVR